MLDVTAHANLSLKAKLVFIVAYVIFEHVII